VLTSHIDREKSTPIYRQLRLIIQDQIVMGDWVPGMLLPTEQEFCDQYQVSRITVRRALDEIARDGLIERIQGKGSLVSAKSSTRPKERRLGFTDILRSQNLPIRSELIDKGLVESNEELRGFLGLDEGDTTPMWRFERLRFIKEEPAVITETFVRKELGDKMIAYDLSKCSFYQLYEELTRRCVISNDGIIKAVSANPREAQLLHVPQGSAHLWFRGVAYIEGNIPIEVNYSIFHGEKFIFQRPEQYRVDKIPAE
jgi:GntR family transcriptional regulator